jgi:exosortase D (VPLPA-CTERM-specific)
MSVFSSVSSRPDATRIDFLFAILGIAFCVIAFSDALGELVTRWARDAEYSHGFLIPLVSLWLLWMRRHALRANIGPPSWAGVFVVFIALGAHFVGQYTTIFIISQIAFVLCLMGLALALGNYRLLRWAFIPIAFFVFAIPVPYFIESSLTLQLQLLSSKLGVDVIRLFQIPVYLEGNIIDLGYYKLQVVEACSGLRYLYPLLSLSFLAAYLFRAPIWQRIWIFLSAIPITIGMNGLRIGIVGVTVDRWGIAMADGLLHFFEGWIIFILCAAILIGQIAFLARISGKKLSGVFQAPIWTERQPTFEDPSAPASRFAPLACVSLMFLAGFVSHSIARQTEIIPERQRFAAFPQDLGSWVGHASSLDARTSKALGLDDYLLSDYRRVGGGQVVNVYVAYYSTQRNGYSPHSPLVCLPGGGWLISQFARTTYRDVNSEWPINRAIIERDGTRELVYYWFDERGRKIANEYWSKWYLLLDAVIKNRTDGALVRVITQIEPAESEENADQRLKLFIKESAPTLEAYLPTAPEPRN